MKRRNFLEKITKSSLIALGAASLSSCIVKREKGTAKKSSGKSFHWKMTTAWPPQFPVLQTVPELFAKQVEEMSDGRLKIDVFAGGELIPPFNYFDAVSKGTVEIGNGAAYYQAGKTAAAQWFGAIPFGLNAPGVNSWLYSGGGLKLWEEVYADFNVIPRPAGNTGMQMGGWFNKEINSVDDFKGLKMRMPGLGANILERMGGSPVLLPGSEIFTSLERGVIDGSEFNGPLLDIRLGLYKAAKYYYTPGWHEPGTSLEFIFNKDAYNSLPKDLQQILDVAAMQANIRTMAEIDRLNAEAFHEIVHTHKVQIRSFSKEILQKLRVVAEEVRKEEAAKSKIATKVNASYEKFFKQYVAWVKVSEKSYFDMLS